MLLSHRVGFNYNSRFNYDYNYISTEAFNYNYNYTENVPIQLQLQLHNFLFNYNYNYMHFQSRYVKLKYLSNFTCIIWNKILFQSTCTCLYSSTSSKCECNLQYTAQNFINCHSKSDILDIRRQK